MANIKELRGRIKSVNNIAKITKAMEMVASMKLRKVQDRALNSRPYTEEIQGLIGSLAGYLDGEDQHPLFTAREVETTGVMLVTSDRGLCGAYNANVLQQVSKLRAAAAAKHGSKEAGDASLKFFVIGRKGYTWLGRRGLKVEHFYAEPPLDQLNFDTARLAAKDLVESFSAGDVDDVQLVFTAFRSAARFEPRMDPFLPLSPELAERSKARQEFRAEALGKKGAAAAEPDHILPTEQYELEPGPQAILDLIIPKYLETVIFDAMMSALASEMASRRMAMKGATDAASRMGKDLKKQFNRLRQEGITKELLDIVGGAAAVS